MIKIADSYTRVLKLTLRKYAKNTKPYAANINTIFKNPNIFALKYVIKVNFFGFV